MTHTLLANLVAHHAKDSTITIWAIVALIDDLDQDLRQHRDWAVGVGICTKREWDKAVARERRNRTLIEILGGVPMDAMHFVELYAAHKAVTVYFDGQIGMIAPGETTISFVERSRFARLCRIAAEKLQLDYAYQSMIDACDEFFEREQRARRATVMAPILYDPVATFDWTGLAAATCAMDDLKFAAAMMKHFVWQVKRKHLGLDVQNHLMLIFGGPQRVGKSTFVERLFSPVAELMQTATFNQITDERIIEIWRAAVIFMDEMSFASKSDADEVKNVITAKLLSRRPMRSNGYDKVPQRATLIGTTNKVLGQLIRDTTGVRRFGYIPFTTTPNRDVINSADWRAAWRSVDENAESPIEEFLPLLIDQQEAQRLHSVIEQWQADLSDHSRTVFLDEQEDRRVISRTILYADFKGWMDDAGLSGHDRLNLQDFTKELQRLAEMTATPMFTFRRSKTGNGWAYNGPQPEGYGSGNATRDKLRLVTK